MQGLLFMCLQELIAIVLGMATFLPEIQGKKVIVYSDNKGAVLDPRVPACSMLPAAGAELSTARGSAKAADHKPEPGFSHACSHQATRPSCCSPLWGPARFGPGIG